MTIDKPGQEQRMVTRKGTTVNEGRSSTQRLANELSKAAEKLARKIGL